MNQNQNPTWVARRSYRGADTWDIMGAPNPVYPVRPRVAQTYTAPDARLIAAAPDMLQALEAVQALVRTIPTMRALTAVGAERGTKLKAEIAAIIGAVLASIDQSGE